MILPGEVAECPDLPPLSNLKLKKTGPDEKCPVVAGGNWVCKFKVTVQNFGDLHERDPVPRCPAFRHACRRHGYVHSRPPDGPAEDRCCSRIFTSAAATIPTSPHIGSRRDPGDGQDSRCARGEVRGHEQRGDHEGAGRDPAQLLRRRRYEFGHGPIRPRFPAGGPGICLSPAMGEPEPPLTTPKGKKPTSRSRRRPARARRPRPDRTPCSPSRSRTKARACMTVRSKSATRCSTA